MRVVYSFQGNESVRDFQLAQILIGRPGRGVVVDLDLTPDATVSRLHARIWVEKGEYWIEDFNSTRGTQVNGKEIKGEDKQRLQPGETVKIGETTLTVGRQSEHSDRQADFSVGVSGPIEKITESLDANISPFESAPSVSLAERRLSLFYELPLQFGKQTQLDPLLQLIVERLVEVTPGAQRGTLLVKDDSTGKLTLKAYVSDKNPAVSLTLANMAMEQQRGFIWPPLPKGELEAKEKAPGSVEEHEIESAMYAPLLWEGEALGAVCVDNNEAGNAFVTDDLRLIQAVAHHAAMALANLRLKEGWQRQTEILNNALRLVSSQVAELLKQQRGRARPGGKFSNVTILLSDIRGFTNLSSTMSLDDVTEMLGDYFRRLVPIVSKYQGIIDKFVGDSILAVFGSPDQDQRQHLHAVQAAMEMQAAMEEVNGQRAAQNKRVGELGIGIHCGEVVHGLIGTADRMEFTVIGDTVNRASRYCDGARGGEVLISPQVFQWVWKHIQADQTSITTKHEGDLIAYRINQLKEIDD